MINQQQNSTSALRSAQLNPTRIQRYLQGMELLVTAVHELSLARDLDTIMRIVRQAALELSGADGATFVLREGEFCYYAEEEAIAPLWKGQRFPMDQCVSGWVMREGQTVVIPDIAVDSRIPQEAYRPTFVKSLVMVPIRQQDPMGAIGHYWARPHVPTPEEINLIQALANTTAVAMENVLLYSSLEQRVKERTQQLETANAELAAFSYSVSHDLRAPLRSINGFTRLLKDTALDKLDERERQYFQYIDENSQRMGQLIDDLLGLSQIGRGELHFEPCNLSLMAEEILAGLKHQEPERVVETQVQPDIRANGDGKLLRIALENLLGNAWKYTSKKPQGCIEFAMKNEDGKPVYFVRDNGAGFPMKYAGKLFGAFQRLHREDEFTGTGIGLATVARVIQRHQGEIWADAAVDEGATFFFTLKGQGV
jgi:signal transduction histidine kinase